MPVRWASFSVEGGEFGEFGGVFFGEVVGFGAVYFHIVEFPFAGEAAGDFPIALAEEARLPSVLPDVGGCGSGAALEDGEEAAALFGEDWVAFELGGVGELWRLRGRWA